MMETTSAILFIGLITVISSILSKRFHKKIIHLYQKENELNSRLETLEIIVRQLETNIMMFSLDLHAHEKKTENDMIELKETNSLTNVKIDTNINIILSKINRIVIVMKTLGMFHLSNEMQIKKEKYHTTCVKEPHATFVQSIIDVDNYGL